MRLRRRFVLCAVLCSLAGVSGVVSTGLSPLIPPEVAELLPQALTLWHWRTLVPFPGGARLTVLAVDDLTEDGQEDVVVSDHQAIYVFAGQADGTFADRPVGFYEVTWHNGRSFTVTGWAAPVTGVLTDMDGDGDRDLAVATGGGRHALHLFRNRGRGGLDKQSTLSVAAVPYRLWADDFTRDGVVDILWWTANRADEGVLYLHKGYGPFQFAEPLAVAVGQGRPFALADMDKDEFLDFGLFRPEGLVILFGGADGFPRRLEWTSPYGEVRHAALAEGVPGWALVATSQGLVSGTLSRDGFEVEEFLPMGPLSWVHVMDLTGDGVEDALVLAPRGWTVVPGAAGAKLLGPASEFYLMGSLSLGVTPRLWPMTLAGRPALVVAHEPFPMVYGIGGEPQGESLLPFEGSYLLAVGDLSGDGAPEVVVEGASGIDVLWNNGHGALVRRPLLAEPVRVVFSVVEGGKLYLLSLAERARGWQAIELWTVSAFGEVLARDVLEEFGPYQTNTVQPVLGVADFDGDGELDLLVLKERAVLVKWGLKRWGVYPWAEGNLGLAVCGRFTRADLPEVALISDAGVFYLAFPKRALEATRAPFQLQEFPLDLACGDLDGDGLDDLALLTLDLGITLDGEKLVVDLVRVRGWALLGAAQQVVELVLPQLREDDAPWPLRGLTLGDFTGDGKNDLAFTTIQGAGVFVLPGRGDGTFGQGVRIARSMGPLFAADLDRNGQHELIGSAVGFTPYLWIRWNGGAR